MQIHTYSPGNGFGILLMGRQVAWLGLGHGSCLNVDYWLLSDEPREQARQRVGGPGAWLKCQRQPGASEPSVYPSFRAYAK